MSLDVTLPALKTALDAVNTDFFSVNPDETGAPLDERDAVEAKAAVAQMNVGLDALMAVAARRQSE
jgi:hypothetical protein